MDLHLVGGICSHRSYNGTPDSTQGPAGHLVAKETSSGAAEQRRS